MLRGYPSFPPEKGVLWQSTQNSGSAAAGPVEGSPSRQDSAPCGAVPAATWSPPPRSRGGGEACTSCTGSPGFPSEGAAQRRWAWFLSVSLYRRIQGKTQTQGLNRGPSEQPIPGSEPGSAHLSEEKPKSRPTAPWLLLRLPVVSATTAWGWSPGGEGALHRAARRAELCIQVTVVSLGAAARGCL